MANGKREWVINTLPLVYDENCKVLILGTMPGKQSRKYGFYYCDGGNRFWDVLEDVFGDRVPYRLCERRDYLLEHHIALWDLCACCTMVGSDDDTIDDIVPNAICCLLEHSNIKTVFFNGGSVEKQLKKYTHLKDMCDELKKKNPGIDFYELPSTSSTNGWWEKEKFAKEYLERWKRIKELCK